MRVAPVLAALVAAAGVLVGCGDDGGGGGQGDEEVAAATCAVLVGWTNDVAATINATEDELLSGGAEISLP